MSARSASRSTGAQVADRIGWALFVVAIALLVAGLALIDQSLLQGAVLILGIDPPLVVLVAAASSVKR